MLYLLPKKLDILGDRTSLEVYIHSKTAQNAGIRSGDLLDLGFVGFETGALAILTDTLVSEEEVGVPMSLWEKYPVSSFDRVALEVQGQAKSIQYIHKKIMGQELSFDEIKEIMYDIAKFRLSPVEMTYFASASYSPGFNEKEMSFLTKAMAETGDILSFAHKKKPVVDKHSIGGLPSKGITPVLVSLMAAAGYIIPNTSTRAITSPAGTSDVLEVLMPVALNKERILEVVDKTNGCLVWGGGLDLAPADDILIQIERPLHIESYDKFIVSITAKKIAAGVTHVLIDLPYGQGTKVSEADLPKVADAFERLMKEFGIKVHVYKRTAKGPDGNGIGPVLEARDLLWILERDKRRPIGLENIALDMGARLIELTGEKTYEAAFQQLREILETGKALEKFWEIGKEQGALAQIKGDELVPGMYSYEIKATQAGKIESYSNSGIVSITKALGAPYVKKAGIYVQRHPGERVAAGDTVATFFAESANRLELAKKVANDYSDWYKISPL